MLIAHAWYWPATTAFIAACLTTMIAITSRTTPTTDPETPAQDLPRPSQRPEV